MAPTAGAARAPARTGINRPLRPGAASPPSAEPLPAPREAITRASTPYTRPGVHARAPSVNAPHPHSTRPALEPSVLHPLAPIPPAATRGSRSVRSGTTPLAGALCAITPPAFAGPGISWRTGALLDPRLVWIASVLVTTKGGK